MRREQAKSLQYMYSVEQVHQLARYAVNKLFLYYIVSDELPELKAFIDRKLHVAQIMKFASDSGQKNGWEMEMKHSSFSNKVFFLRVSKR